jgi:hypothetical protein
MQPGADWGLARIEAPAALKTTTATPAWGSNLVVAPGPLAVGASRIMFAARGDYPAQTDFRNATRHVYQLQPECQNNK